MSENYFVIGYRWGWTNNSHVFLYCGSDLEKACSRADWYSEYRGGKYGCAVYRLDEAEPSEGEEHEEPNDVLVHYSPSIYGESEPSINERIELFERIGGRIVGQHEYPDLYKNDPPISELIKQEKEFLGVMYPQKGPAK